MKPISTSPLALRIQLWLFRGLICMVLGTASAYATPVEVAKEGDVRYTPWHKVGGKLARAIEYRHQGTVALCLQFSQYRFDNVTPDMTYSVGECPAVFYRADNGEVRPVTAMDTAVMSRIKHTALATLAADGDIYGGVPGDALVLPEHAKMVSRATRLGR